MLVNGSAARGQGVHRAHEFTHVLHIAKEAFETVKEAVEDFKDEGE